MIDKREFVKKTLANNPTLTKRHFTCRCSIPAKIVDQLESEGLRFGDPKAYQENARKFKI